MNNCYYIETLSRRWPIDISEKPVKIELPENMPAAAVMQKFYEMQMSGRYGHLTLRHFNGWLHELIAEMSSGDDKPFWYYAYPAYKNFADEIGYSPAFC